MDVNLTSMATHSVISCQQIIKAEYPHIEEATLGNYCLQTLMWQP